MSDEVLVAAPLAQARQRLLAQVHSDGLQAAVAGAFADGARLVASGALAAPDQKLTVHTLPSYLSGAVTVVPLRWYTNSAFDDHFPAVDANLELEQAEHGTSRLGLTGIYRPAAGHVNTTRQEQDARTTIRHFLARMADILATA